MIPPCTPIRVESTANPRPSAADEPSRPVPADDDLAVPEKHCYLEEYVPSNPTAGKDLKFAVQPTRQLNFTPPEPGRSPAVAVSLYFTE